MGSKMLTGSLMFFGPLLGIIMVFLEPSSSDGETFAVAYQKMVDNSALTAISGMGLAIAMLAIIIGSAYLARSMQGEQKPGSDLAGLASVLYLLLAAVVIVSMSLSFSVFDTDWAKKGGDAITAYAVSDGIGTGVFMFMGVPLLLLGIAIFRQKNLNHIVGGIAALFGACMVVGGALTQITNDSSSGVDDITGMIWFIGFLGWIVITVVIGGFTIRSARQDAT